MISDRSIVRLRAFLYPLFLPLSFVFAAFAKLRRRFHPRGYRSSLPVVCVGNIHSGGSGKTPLVVCIAEKLRVRRPAILSRGYGGTQSAVGAKVDLSRSDGPAAFGDEPWMMAKRLGDIVFVGRDRRRSARTAESENRFGILLLDDGLQHLKLARDIDLVAVNTDRSLEDSFCLPMGDLREPLSSLSKFSAVVFTGESSGSSRAQWIEFLGARFPETPFFETLKIYEGLYDGNRRVSISDKSKFAAVCGIARPEGFFEQLKKIGDLVLARPYSDHKFYEDAELTELKVSAADCGAQFVVTTDKDWHKIAPRWGVREIPLVSLRIRYEMPEQFWYFLDSKLERP